MNMNRTFFALFMNILPPHEVRLCIFLSLLLVCQNDVDIFHVYLCFDIALLLQILLLRWHNYNFQKDDKFKEVMFICFYYIKKCVSDILSIAAALVC